jgi:hypothetical protein
MVARSGISAGICALLLAVSAGPASAALLFFEDFEGYTSFPTLTNTFTGVPAGHPTAGTVEERINSGVPMLSEGAKEIWYGARFQSGGGTTDSDLAVQNYGSINRPDDPNRNYTPVGRFEDDAGLAFKVSTLGADDVHLLFGWRTYAVESADRVRVGYRTSNPGFGSCAGEGTSSCFANLTSGAGSWSHWTAFTLSDPSPAGNSNVWVFENFLLPSNEQEVWVAFWLDNGEGDIGKIDNIQVTSSIPVVPVPEPSSALLLVSGLLAARLWRADRHRRRT